MGTERLSVGDWNDLGTDWPSQNHFGSDGLEITSSTPCNEYYTAISLHFLCDCQWNDGAS